MSFPAASCGEQCSLFPGFREAREPLPYTRSVVYEKGELVKEFDESAAGLGLPVFVQAACVNAGANQFGVSWTETLSAGPRTEPASDACIWSWTCVLFGGAHHQASHDMEAGTSWYEIVDGLSRPYQCIRVGQVGGDGPSCSETVGTELPSWAAEIQAGDHVDPGHGWGYHAQNWGRRIDGRPSDGGSVLGGISSVGRFVGSMLWQKRGRSQDNCLHGILGRVEGLTFHYHSTQTTQPNRLLLSLGRMSRRWRKG